MSTFLITGASRGIGLELVKQLAELPAQQVSRIFAVTRGSSQSLQKLIETTNSRINNIIIENITNEDNVSKGVAEVERVLGGKGLDVLINNAGTMQYSPDGMRSLSGNDLREVFDVNVVSVQVITSKFLPLLEKGKDKKIVNISSSMGSIALARAYPWAPTHAYKITKAALNMLTAQYAMELEEHGFTVFAMSPGWLKTDLGSDRADLDVSVGVESVKNTILEAGKELSGRHANIHVPGWENVQGPNKYDGKPIPW